MPGSVAAGVDNPWKEGAHVLVHGPVLALVHVHVQTQVIAVTMNGTMMEEI